MCLKLLSIIYSSVFKLLDLLIEVVSDVTVEVELVVPFLF